jgi:hypothetical protein
MWKLPLAVLASAGAAGVAFAPGAEPAAEAPSGRLVLGLHPPERVAVLDLASGRLEQRRLPGGTLCHGPLMSASGRVLFGASRGGAPALVSLGLDLRGPGLVVRRGADTYLAGAREGEVWTLRTRYRGNALHGSAVRKVRARGGVLLRSRRRPPRGYPMAAVADGIVLEHRGRTRVWDPRTGSVRPAPGTWAVAASERVTAWCSGGCRRLSIESDADRLVARAPVGWAFGTTGSLSPAGSTLAVNAYRLRSPRNRVALVDTRTGTVRLLSSPVPAARGALDWSPSGEWLFVAAAGRRIAAYRPAERHVEMLPVRLPDDVLGLVAAG